MADFNPNFAFDVGDVEQPAQAPWEFSGALQMAIKDGRPQQSSVDQKIAARLQAKAAATSAKRKRSGSAAAAAAAAAAADALDGSDEDDEDGSDDGDDASSGSGSEESDQPLAGELDGGDSSGEEQEEDDDDDDDDEEATSGSDGEEPAPPAKRGAKQQPPPPRAGANGVHDSDDSDDSDEEAGFSGGGGSSSDEEEGDGGGRRANGAGAGPKQKQKQQQQQQQRANGKQGSFYAETHKGGGGGSGRGSGARSFDALNLSRPLLRAVTALGYERPTPIQAACIPLALAGRDICGSAVTGSGKTAAFALPVLERLLYRARQVAATYVLMLAPTRELAAQIHSMVSKLAQFTDVDAALVVGGLSLAAQAAALRSGPAIVVGTPGRVIDHVRNSQGFGLEDLAVLVLDEADRLLEMGFKEELREILRLTPKKRQTLLFSATFNDDVNELAALSLRQPVRLAADPAAAAPKLLAQEVVRLKGSAGGAKEAALLALASRSFTGGRAIVFCRTKQRAHRLKLLFGLLQLPPAAELHGDMTQAARLEALEAFRRGDAAFLICTDVAARGLDVLGVQVVLNYDAPRSLETYLHRVGRTARAGAAGVAVTLAGDEDRALLKEVVKRARVDLKQRLVPAQALARWQARVEAAEADVVRVLAEEHEEAALRRAEMEANKAQNLLDHEAEIFARPARTWFQSERDKRALAAAAAAAAQGRTVLEAAAGGGGGSGGAAGAEAKARAKAAAKQDKRNAKLKERRAAEAAEAAARGGGGRQSELQEETGRFERNIRGVKSRARALREQGLTAKAAQAIAQKAVTGVSTKHEKKKRKTGGGGGGGGGDGGLFSGDGLGGQEGGSGGKAGGGGGKAAGGGRSGRVKGPGALGKTELARLKRGGKGKSSFKSKKRFKRR